MSILAAVNFSDNFQEIVDQAVRLSQALGKKLVLIHVEPLDAVYLSEGAPVPYLAQLTEEGLNEDRTILEEQIQKIRARGIEAEYVLERGLVCQKIIEAARKSQAEMIVVGSHGHTLLMNLLTGSTHEGVLYRSECPVLVVPLKSRELP